MNFSAFHLMTYNIPSKKLNNKGYFKKYLAGRFYLNKSE